MNTTICKSFFYSIFLCRICLMVLMCVVLTLVDIVGMLHFWGLTIDIISCVTIVLAIGLCVDYSVHIGHAYLIGKGRE